MFVEVKSSSSSDRESARFVMLWCAFLVEILIGAQQESVEIL